MAANGTGSGPDRSHDGCVDNVAIFALIIINKAGGLVYHCIFQEGGLKKLSTNDYLVLAGTFHGVHTITTRLNPLKPQPLSSRSLSTAPGSGAGPGPRRQQKSSSASSPSSSPSSSPTIVSTAAATTISTSTATPAAAAAAGGGGGLAIMPSRPPPPSGLEALETENFRLQCFATLTGTKFLLFTDTTQANVDVAMRRIYDLYCDFVMKNPFYQLEMPVRCDLFERRLGSYVREINSR